MPRFAFVARDRLGAPRSGVLEQASFEATVAALRRRNWLVLDVKPEAPSAEEGGLLDDLRPSSWLPVRTVDVELALRQLAVMLSSGMALLDALRLLHEHADRKPMGRVWQRVADDILAGETLGTAMERHRSLPHVAVHLARVGEQTGELHETLRRAAELLEQRRRLRSQIVSAMAYPAVVFVAALGVAGFMVFNVIPKLQRFIESLGRDLPAITQWLVTVTEFIHAYVVHGLVGLIAALVLLLAVRSWPPGRRWTDMALLRVPVIGGTLRLAGTAALARNLQTLLQSGVSLLDSLRSVEQLLGEGYLSQEVAAARDGVIEGQSLAMALGERGAFTSMLARMIAVGESAGRLDDVLGEAATYFEDQLARMIRRLAALVEPVMLIVVGGIVGFVYIAFFMALFAAAG